MQFIKTTLFLVFILLAFAEPVTSGSRKTKIVEVGTSPLILPIIKIIDGDTIKTYLSLPAPLNKVSIRILGIDTPESTWRAKCKAEKALGKKATQFLKDFVGSTPVMTVTNFKWDKFGSRIDGTVFINGKNIPELLIENGFAREYYGKGPKSDWCTVTFDPIELSDLEVLF
jgi:endonuclease YncB( thermonuclease family)